MSRWLAPWLLILLALCHGKPALAASHVWDGRAPIPLGLRAQTQAVLRLPERVNGYLADDPAVLSILTIDDSTLAVSPRQSSVDLRLIVRGHSGNLYVVQTSTALPYVPILEVELPTRPDGTPDEAGHLARVTPLPGRGATPAVTPPGTSAASGAAMAGVPSVLTGVGAASAEALALMRQLLRGMPGDGVRVQASARVLLDGPVLALVSEAVWKGSGLTGIVARLRRTGPRGTRLEVVPERLEIVMPALGTFCLFAADHYVLDDSQPETRALLVFARGAR